MGSSPAAEDAHSLRKAVDGRKAADDARSLAEAHRASPAEVAGSQQAAGDLRSGRRTGLGAEELLGSVGLAEDDTLAPDSRLRLEEAGRKLLDEDLEEVGPGNDPAEEPGAEGSRCCRSSAGNNLGRDPARVAVLARIRLAAEHHHGAAADVEVAGAVLAPAHSTGLPAVPEVAVDQHALVLALAADNQRRRRRGQRLGADTQAARLRHMRRRPEEERKPWRECALLILNPSTFPCD